MHSLRIGGGGASCIGAKSDEHKGSLLLTTSKRVELQRSPIIELDFYNIASIDIMMAQLKRLKLAMLAEGIPLTVETSTKVHIIRTSLDEISANHQNSRRQGPDITSMEMHLKRLFGEQQGSNILKSIMELMEE